MFGIKKRNKECEFRYKQTACYAEGVAAKITIFTTSVPFFMNKKILITIIFIVLLAGVGVAWLQFAQPELEVNEKPGPYLTQSMALYFLNRECLAEGDVYNYASCVVNISEEEKEKRWIVTITYDGLKDASIRASQISTIITYQEGEWIVGEITQTQKCWPHRGHQYFSVEFCI